MSAYLLSDLDDDELRDELLRRSTARKQADERALAPRRWCDECANFEVWTDLNSASPASYNPCAKRHQMQFQIPEDVSVEWGFYRRVCADRSAA